MMTSTDKQETMHANRKKHAHAEWTKLFPEVIAECKRGVHLRMASRYQRISLVLADADGQLDAILLDGSLRRRSRQNFVGLILCIEKNW